MKKWEQNTDEEEKWPSETQNIVMPQLAERCQSLNTTIKTYIWKPSVERGREYV